MKTALPNNPDFTPDRARELFSQVFSQVNTAIADGSQTALATLRQFLRDFDFPTELERIGTKAAEWPSYGDNSRRGWLAECVQVCPTSQLPRSRMTMLGGMNDPSTILWVLLALLGSAGLWLLGWWGDQHREPPDSPPLRRPTKY
jgi:hypothetical protein